MDRCLVEAMDGDVDFGVFGALTPPERRRLRKSMPDVVSWHNYIKSLKKPPLNLSGISVVAYLCTRADVNTFFRRSGSMSNKLSEDTEKAG